MLEHADRAMSTVNAPFIRCQGYQDGVLELVHVVHAQ